MTHKQALFALAALLMLAVPASAGIESGAFSASNVSVLPNPVIAGGYATIKFQLYNSYNFWLYNVNLQPTGSYPLLNVSPLTSYRFGQIGPGLNASTVSYKLAIPNTTPAGMYALTFTATYYAFGSQGVDVATSSIPISFYVQNKPSVKLSLLGAQPAALYAGYNQTLTLKIENAGYGTARNVSVSISPSPGAKVLSSVTSFYISNLTLGQSVQVPILVSASNAGNAALVANVSYSSSSFSQQYRSTQSLNLSVAPSAQFTVSQQSTSAGVGATDVPVTFRVTNTGTSDANQMQLTLQTSYPITPVQSAAYVSTLKPGASTNVTFFVSVDTQGIPGNYPVTLFEQWKQPNGAVNQQFSGSSNYFVNVGQQAGGTTLIIEAVIVVVVILVASQRFMKRGKQQKKK